MRNEKGESCWRIEVPHGISHFSFFLSPLIIYFFGVRSKVVNTNCQYFSTLGM